MPLIQHQYSLANSDGTMKADYTVWERIPGPGPEPMFVPSPVLTVDLGAGPVQYTVSEFASGTLTNPALTCLTVQISKTIDTGGTLFTVLIPQPVPLAGSSQAKLEAVAFRTINRTFLANVGEEYLVLQPSKAAEPFTVMLEAGTYTVEWFNVNTREIEASGSVSVERPGTVTFTPRGLSAGLVVLYLKRAGR